MRAFLYTMLAVVLCTSCGPPPSFDLTLPSTPVGVPRGVRSDIVLGILRLHGYDGRVELSIPNPPAKLTLAFDPASVPAVDTTLHVTPALDAPLGDVSIEVRGVGRADSASASFTLTVE